MQHGVGDRSPRNAVTGVPVAGPATLDRGDLPDEPRRRGRRYAGPPDLDDYYRDRRPTWRGSPCPAVGHELGATTCIPGAVSRAGDVLAGRKWLEVHGQQHWVEFYTDYGLRLQKRFFGHFLKGEDTGWHDQPPVYLNLRRVDGTFEGRAEREWPLARTAWTTFHLDIDGSDLDNTARSATSVASRQTATGSRSGPSRTPWRPSSPAPPSARLSVASSTEDADLFLVLRVQDPHGRDVTFPVRWTRGGGRRSAGCAPHCGRRSGAQ